MRDREHIRNLLFEKISGVIGDADNRFIEDLLANDPEVRDLWIDICQKINSKRGQEMLERVNENAAWESVETKLGFAGQRSALRRRHWPAWVAAAVVLIALGGWYFYIGSVYTADEDLAADEKQIELRLSNGQTISLTENKGGVIDLGSVRLIPGEEGLNYLSKTARGPEWTTVVVPTTKDYKINLSDGTQVWLNADSRLRFPFNFYDSLREVFLEGEGYFTVAENAQQPFIVHAGNTAIRVVGTSFNVNAYDTSTVATALVEGSVMAKAGVEQVILQPGYQAWLTGDQTFTTKPFDPEVVLGWMHGSYYFHDQRLDDISKIMERWFDVRVVFKNSNTAGLKFTGTLEKDKPLQVFITNLKLSSEVKATLTRDTLVIE